MIKYIQRHLWGVRGFVRLVHRRHGRRSFPVLFPALRPVPFGGNIPPGGPGDKGPPGQRPGQRLPAVAPGHYGLCVRLHPGGAYGGGGDNYACRLRDAHMGQKVRAGRIYRHKGPPRRVPAAQISIFRPGSVDSILRTGPPLLLLAGQCNLQQPGHLRRYVHAPELYHKPSPPGDLPPKLLPSAGHKAQLPLSLGQHLLEPLPSGRAPAPCLLSAHAPLRGPGVLRGLAVFKGPFRER